MADYKNLKKRKKDIDEMSEAPGLEPGRKSDPAHGDENFLQKYAHKRAYRSTMEQGRKMQSAFKKRKGLDEYGRSSGRTMGRNRY